MREEERKKRVKRKKRNASRQRARLRKSSSGIPIGTGPPASSTNRSITGTRDRGQGARRCLSSTLGVAGEWGRTRQRLCSGATTCTQRRRWTLRASPGDGDIGLMRPNGVLVGHSEVEQ